ncbi:transposase [Sphaerisporangium perillae]|uniref:transposase n=1 Tax=Sphaerisporangium perillae TaxID=2935860 RepID=UPI003558DE4F
MSRNRRNFSPEFKQEAVKLVIETSRPVAQVAKELGVHEATLGNWVNAYRREHATDEPPLSVSERSSASGSRCSISWTASPRSNCRWRSSWR